MGLAQAQHWCDACEKFTLHARPSFEFGWGCLLSVVTAGLFLPVWLIIKIAEIFAGFWRCQECGRKKVSWTKPLKVAPELYIQPIAAPLGTAPVVPRAVPSIASWLQAEPWDPALLRVLKWTGIALLIFFGLALLGAFISPAPPPTAAEREARGIR